MSYSLLAAVEVSVPLPRDRAFAARTTSAAAAKPGCHMQIMREHLLQWTTSGEATLQAIHAVLVGSTLILLPLPRIVNSLALFMGCQGASSI